MFKWITKVYLSGKILRPLGTQGCSVTKEKKAVAIALPA
jgi:hypothetical protein